MMFLSRREAALRAETDASLANQAAVSKKQAALREAAAAEQQQKIADEAYVTSCTKGHSYKGVATR